MDIRHFKRAEEHRRACEEKSAALAEASDFGVAARRWSEFLVEHQRWFTRMQQALERGPSAAWCGTLKGRRKSDPLLLYLHQARHADEHGLERIADAQPGSVSIGVGGQSVCIERLELENGIITHLTGSQDGGPLTVRVEEAHLKLNEVENRGVTYGPPICAAHGEPYSAIRAARECLDAMAIASEEAQKFFN
jgi:hypothetical protein